jgi:hypothetical protein
MITPKESNKLKNQTMKVFSKLMMLALVLSANMGIRIGRSK